MNEPQDNLPAQALIARERIRGASRMIPEGTDAARVTPEQIAAVANDARIFIDAQKIKVGSVAQAIGYSQGVISEFINGKYKGNQAQVAIDLEHWMVEEETRRSRPATTQFVWTNAALEIKGVANFCLDYRKLGLVYGPDSSGVGKTTALTAIYQELGPRRCSLVTIDKVDASSTGVFKKVCAALRLDAGGTNNQRSSRIVAHLTGRSHLLLVDQIHNLRFAKNDVPFYNLTDIYDATKSPQLWVGTADVVSYLTRQRQRVHDESLSQLRSRISPCVDLMEMLAAGGGGGGSDLLVTVEQVREMFAKNKLKLTPNAARFLCQLINVPDSGGIRLAVQIVEYATMMAVTVTHAAALDTPLLQQAMRRSLTSDRAALMLSQAEIEPQRIAKVA